jgi:hypothetical protein
MKRKSDDKQRTISSFFASAPTSKPQSKPLAQQQQHGTPAAEAAAAVAGPPHSKRHKPSDVLEVIDISDADDRSAATAHAAAAPLTAAGRELLYSADTHAAPPAIPDVRNRARHSKAQAKLVGAPGAASLAEPGAPAADAAVASEFPAGAGGSSSSRRQQQQQQQPKYTPLEQQVVALKAAHPGVSIHIRF